MLPTRTLVKTLRVDWKKNFVIVFSYGSNSNERFDLDIAEKLFTPAFRIGEVAKLLGKKPSTLRKYEREGLLPEVSRFRLADGERHNVRFYSPADVDDLVHFFSRRRGPGPKTDTNYGGVNRRDVGRYIASKYKKK